MLSHPHLQPHILKIHQKLNSPRRNSFPIQWCESNYVRKTRFMDPEIVSIFSDKEKRHSFSNDRMLNPSISETEQDTPSSSRRASDLSCFLSRKMSQSSADSIHESIGINRSSATKFLNTARTPRLTPTKAVVTPKRQPTWTKSSQTCTKRDSVSY